MKFTSIREYFYKLQNILSAIILVPLVLFSYLHLEIQSGRMEALLEEQSTMIIGFLSFIVMLDWIISGIFFKRKIEALRRVQSLGHRLENYANLTIVRFAIISSGGLTMAVGLYLTNHPVFMVLFVINIILLSLFWPVPGKIARDLRLKGDEREMVIHRKDAF